MKKETPPGKGAAHRAGRTTKSVARLATAPPPDFLTVPPENPEDEARRLFPGAEPPQECLRTAFVAIAAARGSSAEAALLLAQLRKICTLDWEELEDSLEGWTIVEGGLDDAAAELEEARRACRLAVAALRRTRRRVTPRRPRGRRKLRVVS